jgi:hypothetical protein
MWNILSVPFLKHWNVVTNLLLLKKCVIQYIFLFLMNVFYWYCSFYDVIIFCIRNLIVCWIKIYGKCYKGLKLVLLILSSFITLGIKQYLFHSAYLVIVFICVHLGRTKHVSKCLYCIYVILIMMAEPGHLEWSKCCSPIHKDEVKVVSSISLAWIRCCCLIPEDWTV